MTKMVPLSDTHMRTHTLFLDIQIQYRNHVLTKKLEPMIQRKDFTPLVQSLPPKYEFTLKIRLSDIQKKLYRYVYIHDGHLYIHSSTHHAVRAAPTRAIHKHMLESVDLLLHSTFQKNENVHTDTPSTIGTNVACFQC